jgi:hypothetical protein
MEKAGKILKDIIEEAGLERGNRYTGIFRSWRDIVGEPLCDHVEIVDIVRNTLVLQMDHPGWFQMFQFSEKEILRRVEESYPNLGIRAMKVRVVSRVEESEKAQQRNEEVRDDERQEYLEAEELESEEDNELFKALNRLYRSIIRRDRKNSRG